MSLQTSALGSENESPSKAGQPDMLFDKQTLRDADSCEDQTLVCLANCVYLVNSTILKERNLLPECYFKPFPVYGDVTGYIVDQSTPEGNKLSRKLNAVDSSIRLKRILKLAIVIEELENFMKPVETFVWNFTFDTCVSAEIGAPGGQMSKFVVDYKNMDVTCKEFCKLFQNLQETFKTLSPLPFGMVPTLKVAYRGASEFSDGFQSVDEFVNMEQIGVGEVSFPFANGFRLSYASEFSIHSNRRTENLTNDFTNRADIFDANETMVQEDNNRVSEPVPQEIPEPFTEDAMEVDSPKSTLSDQATQPGSMICEPNLDSQELEKMTPSDDIRENFEKIRDSRKSPVIEKKERSKKKMSAKKSQKKSKKAERDEYDFEDGEVAPKKKSSRNLFPKKTADSPKEMARDTESMNFEQTRNASPVQETETVPMELSPPKKKKFGSVSTVLGDSVLQEDLESLRIDQNESEVRKRSKYARVSTVLESSFAQEDAPAPTESYGRVASVTQVSIREERDKKFGRVVSVLEKTLENEPEDVVLEEPADEPVETPKRKFGKVASVLRISVNQSDVEKEKKKKKYGRVSTVKEISD